MQHDQSKITFLRKSERTRNARTPDRLDIRNMETSIMTQSPKRKVHMSRQSMMPPSSLNTTNANLRKLELENNNLEMDLIYSKHVSSYAELILEKKKLKDMESSFCSSLRSLQEEMISLQETCKLLETRINDVKALSCFDGYIYVIQQHVAEFKSQLEKYEFIDLLSQLKKFLNRFDILRCENILLPNKAEEVQELKKTLSDCYVMLQQISDPIEGDILENFASNYEEFKTIYHEVLRIKKIVEKDICDLQLEVSKTCSHILSQNET